MVIHDHVFTDYLCNLKCTYCPCEVTLMKRRGNFLVVSAGSSEPSSKETVGVFLERNWEVIRRARAQMPAPVLKLSGGELFLIPEFLDRLPLIAEKYSVVQILTNGTLVDVDVVKRLRMVANVNVQVSLDGHELRHNIHRFRNRATLSSILNGLRLLGAAGIPVEINCVLTSSNAGDFFEYVGALSEVVPICTMYPFPVRRVPRLLPSREQIDAFQAGFEKNVERFQHMLPPSQYFNVLIDFMKSGKRSRPCYVPRAVLSTTGNGNVDACTCGPVKELGNILASESGEVLSRIGRDPCYEAVTEPALSPSCCRDCFTHYDIIDLFIEGLVSLEELRTIPLFAPKGVMKELLLVREDARSPRLERRNGSEPVRVTQLLPT